METILKLAAAILLTSCSVWSTSPELTLAQGVLRGSTWTTRNGRKISAFRRIPFALPPIGNLRFKNPIAAGPWNGIWDATRETPMCAQIEENGAGFVGDEDCLYLDLYTHQITDDTNISLLPVIVYIYGGAYQTGSSGKYLPDYIMDKDVILVVPNYRGNVLGFLSTGDSEAPGNFGLKDQVLALRWVKENARNFGGDPDNVTIFGQSAGASSVQLHTLSDQRLFHKFIADSATFYNTPLEFPAKRSLYVSYAYKLGEYFGCPTNTSSLLIACLREVNISMIVDTNSIFYKWDMNPWVVWQPTAEPDLEGAFLTDTPANLVAAGKMKDVPGIVGTDKEDGLVHTAVYLANETMFDALMNDLDNALPYVLLYHDQVEDVPSFTAALKEYYFNDLTANKSVLMSNFTDLASDTYFFFSQDWMIQRQLSTVKNPFYTYSFEYRGTFSYSYSYSEGSEANFGVAHGDELFYLFPLNKNKPFAALHKNPSKTDMEMVDVMVQLWTSFAINGKPTNLNVSGVTWEPYSPNKRHLRIGNGSDVSLALEPPLHEARMKFWRELTDTYTTPSAPVA